MAGRGQLPRLPWSPSRRTAAAPIRWRAPLPVAVARRLRADQLVSGSSVPRSLAAAVAELLRRYGGEDSACVLVLGEEARVLPLVIATDAAASPAAAVRAVAVAETAARALPALTLGSLAAAFPGVRADERFPVRLAAGARAAPLDEARIVFSLIASGARAALAVHADARWLTSEVVAQIGQRLVALLACAAANPRQPLGRADLVTSQERALLSGPWAGARVKYPAQESITALLRAAAAKRPGALAVEDAAHRLTYGDLLAQAVRLRDALAGARIAAGARVGVLVERSAAQTVALAGVLEAACTAVPLDASLPLARLQRIATIARLDAIVVPESGRALARAIGGTGARAARVVVLAPLDVPAEPASPPLRDALKGGTRAAYVLFTSGSTGEPKGVECPHRAVVRLVIGNRLTRVASGDRVLGHAPFTFDVNLFETWGALLNGAALVHAPAGLLSLAELGTLLASRSITVGCMTPGIFREMAQSQLEQLASLRLLLVAGEAMPPREAVRVAKRYPSLKLVNGYGPTENNYTTEYRVRRGDDEDAPVPIGRPIDNTTVYVVDDQLRLVPPGMIGELVTGGDGLAIGYVGREDLTAERFVTVRLAGGRRERVYRTGDLARHRTDGQLEFLGRADAQVKVRGNRVELEEVERTLAAAKGVASAAAVLVGEGATARLRAALVLAPRANPDASTQAARAIAEERLPSYMVPSEFVVLERLPLTAHEKVDRRAIAALPLEAEAAPVSRPRGRVTAASTARVRDLERALAAIWADLLGRSGIDRDAAFFEIGGTSLLALRLAESIRVTLGVALPIVRVFEFPTIARMAAHLAERERGDTGASGPGGAPAPRRDGEAARAGALDRRIAIIGVAGRFPGAPTPDALWTLLREEREGVRHFARDEIDPSIADRLAAHYSPVRGVLDDVESFDPEFFGMSPRVAEITDPQQRLLLEAAWDAFEHAGVVPGDGDTLTGVFTGVSHDAYESRNLRSHPELIEALGETAVLFANDKDYGALHIAHRLDLRGPAMAVQTSSSTSLTAIAMAAQALRSGQCDLALAGGAAVTVPVQSGHAHIEGGMFSRDGHTRTFDADASGTVFSDGVAMVLLQRLEDAERDGRRVLGVIHGVGVTNDGAARASFSAPTVQGQAECIARAYADAGWSADSVSYVEAHGTGTPLGDPIEIEALTRAFAHTTERRRFCWIGSVKSNIGHLTAAAGAVSVIKVLLAMRHRWIPRTLHVDRPNPRIDFEQSPFLVARAGVPWESDGAPRRAGVSSFGVGGTNVHLLIEEPGAARAAAHDGAPHDGAARGPTGARSDPRMLFLSARSPGALRARARDVATVLRAADAPALEAVAAELRVGRRAFERRAVVVASTRDEALSALDTLAGSADAAMPASGRAPAREIVLLFPGQGTQTAGAGRALYASQPLFRDAIDRCIAAAGRIQGKPLSHWLFDTSDATAAKLRETDIAQPVLFAIEYALGHLVVASGLRPGAMVGHSIGEYAAAAIAGVMSPADAMRAVTERGRLMAAMTPGAMLAVRATAADTRHMLGDPLVIAAENAPRLTVVAGPEDAIAALESSLASREIGARRLLTSHAFHSPSMDEAARRFALYMRGVTLRAPELPFISCVSGAFITDAEAMAPEYWARQLREPVLFAAGLAAAARDRHALLVEAGPRETLSSLGLQILPGRAVAAPLLPLRPESDEDMALLEGIGALWRHGVDGMTWSAIDRLPLTSRVNLPGYPFERRRLWIEPAAASAGPARPSVDGSELPALLQTQLHLIEDQLSVLRRVAPGSGEGVRR